MFGALQTQYFGLLLRRAAWIILPLTGLPAVALASYVAAEYVLNRTQAGDADSSSEEEEEEEEVLVAEQEEGGGGGSAGSAPGGRGGVIPVT